MRRARTPVDDDNGTVGRANQRSRRGPAVPLLALALLCSGCKQVVEFGQLALLTLPLVHVIMVGLFALVRQIWRRTHPALRIGLRAQLVTTLLLGGVVAVFADLPGDSILLVQALWIYGSGVLAIAAVVWAALERRDHHGAFVYAPIIASTIAALAAVIVSTGIFGADIGFYIIGLWTLSGFSPIPVIFILVAFLIAYRRLVAYEEELDRRAKRASEQSV